MIADSNKNILQMNAMSEKCHWIPPFPNTAENVKPKLTSKLLAELSNVNLEQLELLKSIETPSADEFNGRVATDWRTGQVAKDPEAAYQDATKALEKMLQDCENRQKALDALLDEADRANGN